MQYVVNPTEIGQHDVISFDTEYSELNIRKAELLSISIGVSTELTYIFNTHAGYYEALCLLRKAKKIYTWNMTVDWFMIIKTWPGVHVNKSKFFDGMLAEHLYDERLSHSLGEYALREFSDGYKKEFWSMYKSYSDAPKEVACEYEMRDGCYTFHAGEKYSSLLRGKEDLLQHVHRLQWALFDTEIKGIKVDVELMRRTKEEMSAKIAEYIPKLREEFNDCCNLWELNKWKQEIGKRKTVKGRLDVERPCFSFTSDSQLRDLLYGSTYLGIEAISKTKKGSPRTDYETLKAIAENYPKLQTLVEYKDVKSVYATFVEGMLDRVENERIYPGFFINGTTTGRISHNNPNMGNLPREGVIRNFFIPDEGNSIVGADYSQLEVVVEANLTEDKQLLKIINEGASKHDITAEGLGIDRSTAKTLNFALQYGAGTYKVAKILGVSKNEAEDIFRRYWELYSGVRALKEETGEEVRSKGQITNIFGRIRHFERPKNQFEEQAQFRQAYNFKIQGPASDMTNMATYLVQEHLLSYSIGRLLFSVHDELVVEAKDSCLEEATDAIVRCMGVPNDYLNLKYHVTAKSYGPLRCWSKT